MVKERRDAPRLRYRPGPWLLAIAWGLLAGLGVGPVAAGETGTVRLTDAAERGAFNVGAARGTVGRATDPIAGEVLTLDYTVPQGTAVGVWTKRFPADLKAGDLDVARAALKASDPDGIASIAAVLEIKGTAGTQRVPLDLQPGWTAREHLIDWKAIGGVTEVVVSVNRVGDGAPASGSLAIDVAFERLPYLRRISMVPVVRLAAVLVVAAVVGCLAALSRLLFAGWRSSVTGETAHEFAGPTPEPEARALRRDVTKGVGAVAIVGLAIAVYVVGGLGGLDVGWTPLGLAVVGVLIAEWWKFGLTGRHLSVGDAVRDTLATGLLAASASPLSILQAPGSWGELLRLSQPVAAVVALLYHAANAGRLATSGKRLGPIAGAMIVGTPFAVGALLLLETGGLVRDLGIALTAGIASSRPALAEFLGRVLVLFAFNELVAGVLGLATKRTALRSLKAHGALLAVAVMAIAGPWVAALGSGEAVASWSALGRLVAVVAATVVSQAGLWAEAYLLTGMVTDALRGTALSEATAIGHPVLGLKKAMVFSGIYMGGLHLIALFASMPGMSRFATESPLILGALVGALVFPLVKTIIETFDGSQAFFRRVASSYRDPVLYARGAVVGLGLAFGFARGMSGDAMSTRILFGFAVGVAAYAGVNFVRDALAARAGRGRLQSWRVYAVQSALGGFIAAALGFYLDATQVAVIVEKFHRYVDPGQAARPYDVYPLLSKWGLVTLGSVTGGASLLFAEALAGVISWSIPSWLFAINRTFMAAYFDRDPSPIRSLFTRAGLVQLVESMIGVLRWGLWMSPIINSFLRPMGQPTWYNQDGAIHTVLAIAHDATSTPEAFRAWSLGVFIALLAHDWVRILIWLDHMGLRVATLVNLSFLGMDKLDRRLSRFLAPAATARCIPEAVKRFTTWAPLLIPYYIPRGADWDYAWSHAEAIRARQHGGPFAALTALPLPNLVVLIAATACGVTAAFVTARWFRDRSGPRRRPDWTLANREYEVTLKETGEVLSKIKERDYDVTRRSYDRLDPAGRALFLVDPTGDAPRSWTVLGNIPGDLGEPSRFAKDEHHLKIRHDHSDLRATVAISLPGAGDPAELWSITVENASSVARRVEVVPYVEWVLNRADADRGHTQYNRLFAEMEYAHALHAVLAWDKHAKALGFLASDVAPSGFLTSRIDFIGRARSLWSARILETLAFSEPKDTDAHPTFDPIGSLRLGATVPPRGSVTIRLLIGLTADKSRAIDLIARHLAVPLAAVVPATTRRKATHSIGHGEIPPGTPSPYSDFSDDGRTLLVHTPFTTRPYDHTLSNAAGHVVVVTNRGLHTTSSVNAQQNRVTPDWSDTVTREVPSEAFYLYDPASREWFTPTYHPLNDAEAGHKAEFGLDGSAVFRAAKAGIETELTVFVPPDEPVGVYRLTIRNQGESVRRLRVASYFQIVLAAQPEFAGPLRSRVDRGLGAVFFENPRNTFRTGPAFAAMACDVPVIETSRSKFFGDSRAVAHPYFVEHAAPDASASPAPDDRPVAAFLTEIEIPPRGERTVVVILGQADDRATAEAVVRKFLDPAAASGSLDATRRWWTRLMDTVTVETDDPAFDHYLDWLKYQALAVRIWARRGFYQASGAFGFRDQLQDSVNLLWVDPAIARRQILLHASQQFLEGDVVHWFHLLQDGRTGFVGRTHASDNLLWLPWAVVEYLGVTGDDTLLDERAAYLETDLPFEPLPAGKEGMGFDPLRSALEDTVYRHCLRAIDLVLDRRMGVHGLPLMGTGDWNDGLDAIGSEGKGESVWLGFFLAYILERMIPVVERKDGPDRRGYYVQRLDALKDAVERTWRHDRYLRAFNDDGIEIGVAGSGVWEIDALTAAWAVMSGINPDRGRVVFETALRILEKPKTILLGWPPLRPDNRPYLGRSSQYPEGVRENGMYCHGVQWLVGAARKLAEQSDDQGRPDDARQYRETAHRLWSKIAAIAHTDSAEIETYGGPPNQQAADMVTTFDPGRMIWNGYTGAAGWVFRQAIEGVLGFRLDHGVVIAPPHDPDPARVARDLASSPFGTAAPGEDST